MLVQKGAGNVNAYFKIPAGLTVTDFDFQYTRSGAAPSTKVDVTALGAAGDPHDDNKGIYVDATTSPGLFRFCPPDAAFSSGVDEVILTLLYATGQQESIRVTLYDNTNKEIYDRLGAPSGASMSADIATIDTVVDALAVSIASVLTQLPDILSLANIKASVKEITNTDTNAELTGVPAKDAPMVEQLQWLFMKSRNLNITDGTTNDVHNDAGTKIADATVLDDGSTFTRSKFT